MPRTHIVKQGENLNRIAKRYGFGRWQELYSLPDNTKFRQLRPNPNILNPGDEIAIPEPTPVEFLVAPNQKHTFIARRLVTRFQMQLLNEGVEQLPFANARFRLKADSLSIDETSDASGWIHAELPLDTEHCQLELWADDDATEPLVWQLCIHHLDPVNTQTGTQARLHNLGFDCPFDDEDGDKTSEALALFQQQHGIDEGDDVDTQTQEKLEHFMVAERECECPLRLG